MISVAILAAGGAARADGAFPDSEKLILPVDRPDQIVLSTNFGLVSSDDGGATWSWVCEQGATAQASLYLVSAPPMDRLFAVAVLGLAHSDDLGCSWTIGDGLPVHGIMVDAFADPTDARRVFQVVAAPGVASMPDQVFLSQDGGETIGTPIFVAASGVSVTSVESSASDPQTIYVATSSLVPAADYPVSHPVLAVSTDGGQSWVDRDAEAGVGSNPFRIIAVDPVDPQTVYLRSLDVFGEKLAITRDGGQTFTAPVTLEQGGTLTAFARLGSGTILVTGLVGNTEVGFRSTDGAASFVEWPNLPYLKDLAERGGRLFAATDNLYENDWAVAVSSDEGVTFEPLMAYDQVRSEKLCAAAMCRDTCLYEAASYLWPASVCGPEPTDGGGDAVGKGAGEMAGSDKFGCSCRVGEGGRAIAAWIAAALGAARSRRRRPSRRG